MIARTLITAGALAVALGSVAHAEPYRLRGQALAQSRAPAGLLVLDSEGKVRPWLSAEALVWTGAGGDEEANVLVIAVKARHADRAEATLGRFVLVAGALRPVHVDGARARVEAPWDTAVELFGGSPVAVDFGPSGYDWLAGGRVSRTLGERGTVGLAFMHRRDHGRLSDEEVALDAGGALTDRLDVGSRVSYDLIQTGLSEVDVRAGWRGGASWRLEAFATHRSPSRILPATSLFSVLGDVPGRIGGVGVRWRAAPRLDLHGSAGGRAIGDDLGVELRARALLRLDDRGAGALSLEGRRESGPDGDWTGARLAARVPVADAITCAAEFELVVPDDSGGRGEVWPWALAAVGWQPAPAWNLAAALEASASPEYTSRLDALLTVSRAWELTP
jgi:hypothetical protein